MHASPTTLQNNTLASSKKWNLKLLLLWHIVGALLLTSLFWPVTRVYWEMVDVAIFKMINTTLKDRPTWQLFWACANHRIADWVEDICILGFFIAYVKLAPKPSRLRKVAELLFCALLIGAVIYFVNQLIFRENVKVPRLSPTHIVEDCVRLSQEIPWMKVKDASSKSFPGDHGTTALLFGASFSLIAGWRLGLPASLYAAFLCIPRMITGAHWFSDIVVGSGTITMIALSWAFCSPLFTRFTNGCERLLKRIGSLANFS